MEREVCDQAAGPGIAGPDEAGSDPLRRLLDDTASFAHAYLRWLDAQAADGLTLPRLRLVERLHCEGPDRMGVLADEIGLSPRNMTALVDGLEGEGLVRRVPHSTDRRCTVIEATPDGMAAAEVLLEPHFGAMSCLFRDLSEEQRAQFSEILGTLRAGMKARTPH
jgi:DNA-binding MarR family transcriptional regulator